MTRSIWFSINDNLYNMLGFPLQFSRNTTDMRPWILTITIRLHSYKLSNTFEHIHYGDVIMGAMASQITGADHRKHQSSASLAFVRGIHRWPVDSMHKGLVMRKMFPFDDVIIVWRHMASWIVGIIDLGNVYSLLPIRHQAISRTNAFILAVAPPRQRL